MGRSVFIATRVIAARTAARAPLAALGLLPGRADAHASEQSLAMLLPTDVYIASGTAVVALTALLSFVVPARGLEAVFRTRGGGGAGGGDAGGGDARDGGGGPGSAAWSWPVAAGFAALVAIGLAGPRDPLANLLPLTVWTLWWIGLPTVQAVLGDLWRRANPWSGPLRLLARRGRDEGGPSRLPDGLGSWPAVALLVAVNGFVLADPAPSDPERLAVVALAYWAFTLAMAWRFGEGAWLTRGEAFSVMFARFAEMAPVGRGAEDGRDGRGGRAGRGRRVGVPGWQLVHRDAPDVSLAAVYLVLLAAGSFDGLHETFRWLLFIDVNPLEYPGRSAMIGTTLAGLGGTVLAVALAYLLACAAGAGLARDRTGAATGPGAGRLFRALAPSLLPIAVAYHVAHYLTSFLVDAQYVPIAASDPLGTGRDLFGTAGDHVTAGFFNVPASVRAIWLTQAGVVVAGHALAVLVAHARALALFEGMPCAARRAVRAHAPLAALMLGYTLFGLWLLASPRGA